jgi:hypothetical protein
MIMPTLMVLLVWLVAGLTLLIWWEIAHRVIDALGEIAQTAARRRESRARRPEHLDPQGLSRGQAPSAERR